MQSELKKMWCYKTFSVRLILLLILLCACSQKGRRHSTIFGNKEDNNHATTEECDLPMIQDAGVLIGITLSGPDTYYEYRGQEFGLQFLLAEEFARNIGVRLQMEIAPDTMTMLERLEQGEADFIALEITKDHKWKIREDEPLLQEKLDKWWDPRRKEALAAQAEKPKSVRRKVHPLMKNRKQGIISQYDDLFVKYASEIGWDWRLLAAQCYQESAFDPKAVSWAGAQGLMQIMPGTASQLGLATGDIFNPDKNIAASVRYIKSLIHTFSDIPGQQDRICFVLAGYNGGTMHIRDAMALTKKYGGDEHRWKDVAPYVVALTNPQFYRDPIVQKGFMRGNETDEYVRQIIERWQDYRGAARAITSGSIPAPSRKNMKEGEFHSHVKSAEELMEQREQR